MLTLFIYLVTAIMMLDCLFLVLLVLVQLPKKEAGMGQAFGGAATDAFAHQKLVIPKISLRNAGSGGDPLNIAGMHHGLRAHAVFVLERSADDVADDFEVAMRVCAEALAGLNPVFVNHAQAAKPHVPRIMVFAERERMLGVEPTVVLVPPISCTPHGDHAYLLSHLARARIDG